MKSKKVLAIILAMIMMAMFVLSACNSNKQETPQESQGNQGGQEPSSSQEPQGNQGGQGDQGSQGEIAKEIVRTATAYLARMESEAKPGGSSSKDTLVFAAVNDPGKLDLGSILEFTQYPLASMALQYFMRYNSTTGQFFSPVCESYEVDPDFMGVTFHLYPNIIMTDGKVFTPEDVFVSMEAFRAWNFLGWQSNFIDLDRSEVIDENTFHFAFNEMNAVWETSLQMFTVYSGEAYLATGGSETFFTDPVGPMAYSVSEWVPGDHITIVRNEDYFAGTPPIKYVTMRVISDRTSAFMALQRGEIDLLWNISADQVETIYGSDDLEQVVMGENMMIFLGMNSGNAALSDYRVRKAIFLAIDRQDIIDGAYNGLAYPSVSIFTRDSIGYDTAWDANPTLPGYDVEAAKALMAEAGYADGLTLRVTAESTINFQLVCEQLAAMLGEIGITLDVRLVDYATLANTVFTDDTSSYDMYLYVCQDCDDSVFTIDNPMLFGASHPELSSDGSGAGWIALADQIRAEQDINKRGELYRQWNTYFVENGLYWVPVAVSQTYVGLNKDFTGAYRISFHLFFEGSYFR